MIQKVKKFTKLSTEEKKLFLEAYVMLGMMRTAILTVSFKRLTRSLEHFPIERETIALDKHQMSLAKK
jgi:hypothetical protein